MPPALTDVIDALADIKPGSALDAVRNRRSQAREQAEASFRALFEPESFAGVSATERFALAVFVTGLHGDAVSAAFYAERLAATEPSPGVPAAIDAAIAAATSRGPYGCYPAGPLSREDTPGPSYHVEPEARRILGGAWTPPSITRTSSSSIRATPRRQGCKRSWMPAGPPPTS